MSFEDAFRTFPLSLESLTLGACIFEPGIFPSTLRYLHVSSIDKDLIPKNVLPPNLTYFMIPKNLHDKERICEDGALPLSLQTLKIPESFDKPYAPLTALFASLPSLTKVEIQTLWLNNNINESTFPASVRCLELERVENINEAGLWKLQMEEIEITLTCLDAHCGRRGQLLSANIFPPSLKVLTLPEEEEIILQPGSLPSSLTKLSFNLDSDQSIVKGVLPSSLGTLTLSWRCDGKIEELPHGLQYLYVDIASFRIDKSIVPPGLQIQPISPICPIQFPIHQEMFYSRDEEMKEEASENEAKEEEGEEKEADDKAEMENNSSRKRKRSTEGDGEVELQQDEDEDRAGPGLAPII